MLLSLLSGSCVGGALACDVQWERRVRDSALGYHAKNKIFIAAPLIFNVPGLQNSPMYIRLQELCNHWIQVDGARAALSNAPRILCIHVSRTYQNAEKNFPQKPSGSDV